MAFRWESYHRGDAGRVTRKVVQCVVDLVAFCVVPLAALVVYWGGGQVTSGLLVLSLAEAGAVAGLGVFVVRYAVPFGSGASGSGGG